MAKSVVVHIGKDGNPKFDFGGFSGDSCFKENEEIWKELGNMGIAPAEVLSSEKKMDGDGAPKEQQLEEVFEE